MCSTQCVLALLALYVGLAHSFDWDIAVVRESRLEFYTDNGTLTHTDIIPSSYYSPYIKYDAVHNRILFVNRNYLNPIFSFDITTKKIQYLARTKYDDLQSLAYDPVTDTLFWFEKDLNNGNTFSLKPGNEVYGDLHIEMGDVWPREIAVDSCGGFFYWMSGCFIYRGRLNGSKQELWKYHGTISTCSSYSLTIEQQTRKMYWITINHLKVYSFRWVMIHYADLDGKFIKTLYQIKVRDEAFNAKQKPYELLAVSKDYVYWGSPYETKYIWQFPKNPRDREVKPKEIVLTDLFVANVQLAITANYKIEDQTQGIQNCEALKNLRSIKSANDCVCREYCLNRGVCSLNENSEPVCQCAGDYQGDRCEVPVFLVKSYRAVAMLKDILDTDVTSMTLGKVVEPTCASTVV